MSKPISSFPTVSSLPGFQRSGPAVRAGAGAAHRGSGVERLFVLPCAQMVAEQNGRAAQDGSS